MPVSYYMLMNRVASSVLSLLLFCGLCEMATPVAVASPARQQGTGNTRYDRSTLRKLVWRISHELGMESRLIDALVQVESGYNPRAVSRKGAQGLMQLMPATARRLHVTDPFDPEQNIRAGVRELARLLDYYAGDLTLALAAYNAGQGAVARYQGVPPYRETQNYIVRILSLYTGKPYRLAARPGRSTAPQVRLVRDPQTGEVVITNQRSRSTTQGEPKAVLGGGFGS